MLVAIIPGSLDDFAGMRFVLFDSRIGKQTNIVVNVEIEKRA